MKNIIIIILGSISWGWFLMAVLKPLPYPDWFKAVISLITSGILILLLKLIDDSRKNK